SLVDGNRSKASAENEVRSAKGPVWKSRHVEPLLTLRARSDGWHGGSAMAKSVLLACQFPRPGAAADLCGRWSRAWEPSLQANRASSPWRICRPAAYSEHLLWSAMRDALATLQNGSCPCARCDGSRY